MSITMDQKKLQVLESYSTTVSPPILVEFDS